MIEAEFGRRIEELLSLVDRPSITRLTPVQITGDPGVHAPTGDDGGDGAGPSVTEATLLGAAAAESAQFALWQGVDQLCVDTLVLRLSRLAHDYVSAEMEPVVRAIYELRAETIELLPRAGGFGRELYFVAGVCSAVLAHAAGNLGQLDCSPWHINAALRFAELGRLPVLAVWALSVQALQLEWTGHPARSLDTIARAATFLEQEPAALGTAAWLAAIEARAHARRGDTSGTRRALDRVAFHRDQMADATHTTATSRDRRNFAPTATRRWPS